MQPIRGELELRLMVLRCSAVCYTDSMSLTSLAYFDGSTAVVMKVLPLAKVSEKYSLQRKTIKIWKHTKVRKENTR